MAQFFQVHPETPQPRLIKQAVQILDQGGLIAYPTDSGYALGCTLGNKSGVDKMKRIRRLDDSHFFTLICDSLSDIAQYARVNNVTYRVLKAHTPGAYTFILQATSAVPRMLFQKKRRQIGIRIPEHQIARAIVTELGQPLLSSTLMMPGDEYPLLDPYDIRQLLEHELSLVMDGGYCGMEPTSVIDLTGDEPVVLRQGLGNTSDFA